jgi:hypothetical protein
VFVEARFGFERISGSVDGFLVEWLADDLNRSSALAHSSGSCPASTLSMIALSSTVRVIALT